MTPPSIVALAALIALAAVGTEAGAQIKHKQHAKASKPAVYAGCQKENCFNDPAAWAALMGSRAQDRAAQAEALRTAQTVVAAQPAQSGNSLLRDLSPIKREELMGALEETLTRAGSAPAHVLVARARVREGGFLFCGSALYGTDGRGGVFIVDTSPSGTIALDTDRDAYIQAGCDLPAVDMR